MDQPRSLNDKLNGLSRLIAGSPEKAARAKPARDLPERYGKLQKVLGGEMVEHSTGRFLLLRKFFPEDYLHGQIRLATTLEQQVHAHSSFTALERDGQLDIQQIIYFDTETTGLGGVGIVPFLVGCGSVVPGGFEVRQYLLPDYSDEAAMLEVLQAEFGPDKVVVTYNGAAFDLPVMRDRLIVNRVARELQYGEHIDLLHSARRLFKRRLKECNLTHVERRLFGFERQDDIPGYLVPSVYFEWLSAESLEQMTGVLDHNCYDIISLHFLLSHVASTFATEGDVLDQSDDLYSLSRVYRRRKRDPQVLSLCKRIAEEATVEVAPEMELFHAAALKRAGSWEEAVSIWSRLTESDSRQGYQAAVELAVYYEHRAKDLPAALKSVNRAAAICPYGPSERLRLTARRERIQSKLSRA